MKRLLVCLLVLGLCGCQKTITYEKINRIVQVEEEAPLRIAGAPPEGMYFNELSGVPIPLELKNQRPIAVMIDNELFAYPHSGMQEADVVYEMINSLHNGRITRLMALKKDWASIEQMGSIRSTRDTNILLQAEWNSILCHDGASSISLPLFNYEYARDHLSGTFSRINNGKNWEFTEFIVKGDIEANLSAYGISKDYTKLKPDVESHFHFVTYEREEALDSDEYQSIKAITLPFPHNNTQLHYSEERNGYDYYNYGEVSVDGEDGDILSFRNVIIQDIEMYATDNDGHVRYQLVDSGKGGYYLSNGRMQKITWEKKDEMDITRYYDEDGEELKINRGNTYIALVPSDVFAEIVLK